MDTATICVGKLSVSPFTPAGYKTKDVDISDKRLIIQYAL